MCVGMARIFQNGINHKYYCGFGCGCGFVFALTIGAAIDVASATAGFYHHLFAQREPGQVTDLTPC